MRRLCCSTLSLFVLSGALSLQACAKKGTGPKPDPAFAAATQSLEQLKADAKKLQAETGAIHKRLERLETTADDLPGLAAYRSNLFATEEILGGVSGTSDYLTGELGTALAAGDKQQAAKITATITSSAEEMKKFERTVMELSHGLIPFERTVAQYRALADAGVFFTRVLPTGYRVSAANDGIEERLLGAVDKNDGQWLPFDRVWFTGDDGHLDLGPSSEQLESVAAILKAYPNAKLELAGFTEATAPAQLARGRAQTVKDRLIDLGVTAARLKVASHGRAQTPCAGNDVKDCRAKQPRVAARVVN